MKPTTRESSRHKTGISEALRDMHWIEPTFPSNRRCCSRWWPRFSLTSVNSVLSTGYLWWTNQNWWWEMRDERCNRYRPCWDCFASRKIERWKTRKWVHMRTLIPHNQRQRIGRPVSLNNGMNATKLTKSSRETCSNLVLLCVVVDMCWHSVYPLISSSLFSLFSLLH